MSSDGTLNLLRLLSASLRSRFSYSISYLVKNSRFWANKQTRKVVKSSKL